ncbi:MAG: hypothetical protein AB1896_05935 [Thermodesulfobacteriota bacterium]
MKKVSILMLLGLLLSPAAAVPARAALEWGELLLNDHQSGYLYRATSELKDPGPYEFGPYGGHNLFDKNPATCWAEGRPGPGLGEALYVGVNKYERTVHILNGYHKSPDLFHKNNRVRQLRLTMFAGFFRPDRTTEIFLSFDAVPYPRAELVTLEDSRRPQEITLPWDWTDLETFMYEAAPSRPPAEEVPGVPKDLEEKYILRLEILQVYPGSQYDDTCLSELWLSR